ncbi:exported hypothetical protein [Cupriavidus oxalaticus]|uniref:Secreted protein n=1 Tax=Cupriavidus oxalaticus TaxID=96344 RepID=A0A375G0Y2_9BURK|nr:exported hypothetical protein [Cupriavidus oxalaticus]SPC12402.1 exported hypothetical protein [Cupriavidus oxalaticus]
MAARVAWAVACCAVSEAAVAAIFKLLSAISPACLAARCIVSNKLVVAVSADCQAAMAASEPAGAPFLSVAPYRGMRRWRSHAPGFRHAGARYRNSHLMQSADARVARCAAIDDMTS